MSSHKEDNEENESQEESSYFGYAAVAAIGAIFGAGIMYLTGRSTPNPQCSASSRNNFHSSPDVNFRNREKVCERCTVCLEDVQYVVTLPCGHFFHPSCIKPWLKVKQDCPTCRMPVPPYFVKNV